MPNKPKEIKIHVSKTRVVRISMDNYATHLCTTTNGYQSSCCSMEPDLAKAAIEVLTMYLKEIDK